MTIYRVLTDNCKEFIDSLLVCKNVKVPENRNSIVSMQILVYSTDLFAAGAFLNE